MSELSGNFACGRLVKDLDDGEHGSLAGQVAFG